MEITTPTGHLSETVRSQLEDRGLDSDLAQALGLYSEPSQNGNSDALVMPFIREGKVVKRKFRTLDASKRFWQDKSPAKLLWNEDCLRDDSLLNEDLVICEGEMDTIAVIQCGHHRAVSMPEGAPATAVGEGPSAKYDFLFDDVNLELLSKERVKTIIIAADGDSAGAAMLTDLSARLGRYRCKWVVYPLKPQKWIDQWPNENPRCKDFNEVLLFYGMKGVKATLAKAEYVHVPGIYAMSELPPSPDPKTYDIGIPFFRDHFRLRMGDFIVVTGIPSMGKSSLVNDLLCRLAENHGLHSAIASFEQHPTKDHRRNLRTWHAKWPAKKCTAGQLSAADQWIDKHFSFMVPPDDQDVSLHWTLEMAELAVVRRGANIIVVDPWNEMDHMRMPQETMSEYTGRAIKAFKRFARAYDVAVIVVAHPTKMEKDKEGNFRVPTLYDISDSANWYNKADVGLVVHREDDKTILRNSKSRYHDEIGTPGEVYAKFSRETNRYTIVNEHGDPMEGDD